jgi:hypothetical protein
MAILLMRKMGRPAPSSANGISDPKGNPGCLREIVDRVAMETSDMSVRARSAWLGSGSSGDAGPVDACWRGAAVSLSGIILPPVTSEYGSDRIPRKGTVIDPHRTSVSSRSHLTISRCHRSSLT